MKIFIKVALFLSVVLFATETIAGVRFIIDSPTHTHRDILKGDAGAKIKKACYRQGYNRKSCRNNEIALEFCPQDSSYFKYCCPEGYSSTKQECYDQGMRPSSKSCHGYYMCETQENEYDEKEYYSEEYEESGEYENYPVYKTPRRR